MKPTNAGVIPNVSAAFCTDSTKISLTSATSTVTPANVARASPIGHGAWPASPDVRAGEQFGVRLQRKQHTQPVRADEQEGQTDAQLLGERGPRDRVGLRNRRGNQQRDRRQEQQARLHAGADTVVFLDMILESAEEKGRAQHEQRVGDDRAGHGRLHQHILPGAQGGERNDQLRQIAQRGVEETADRIPRLGRHGFGGVTEQRRQRYDGQD